MNLNDAISSGRKFRRLSDPKTWFRVDGQKIAVTYPHGSSAIGYNFTVQELMATDWAPEAAKMELTGWDILEAAKAVMHQPGMGSGRFSVVESAKLIVDQLGLDTWGKA